MKFDNVSIVDLAHVDAPHRITSLDIEEMLAPAARRLGLKHNLIAGLTGIIERRWWDPETSFSDAATLAAEKVLEKSGLDRSKPGILLSTSVCKDYIEPSMASLVHGNLGLSPECMNLDVGNACLAFINGMEIVGNMIERGQVEYGIIVNAEGSRAAVEQTVERLLAPESDVKTFFRNFATLTLGSGAAAMILARSDLAPQGHRVVGGVTLAATKNNNRLCLGRPDGMITDSNGLLRAGLKLAVETWEKACRDMGWPGDVMNLYAFHQISKVHTTKFCDAVGIDQNKVFKTFPMFGNIGPAAVPITLSKALDAGRVKPGDRIGLFGIGSGINCCLMEVAW